jgi:hypothetical protein
MLADSFLLVGMITVGGVDVAEVGHLRRSIEKLAATFWIQFLSVSQPSL